MKLLVKNGQIVNEGKTIGGSLLICDGRIEKIFLEDTPVPCGIYDEEIDATGCFVLPGVIDEHVHFREPGLTRKADIESESRAAAVGGVTTFFDMPNTTPQTTSPEALADKFERAARESHINYSFFFGATNGNSHLFAQLDHHRIPGIKLFMGASTGNMLVDREEALREIFKACATLGLPLMTHCEDTAEINRNMVAAKAEYGEDPDIRQHPAIRSDAACYASTSLAVSLAREFGTRLHVAHLTTARELELFGHDTHITAEAVIPHLWFSDVDYLRLGSLIKCNPAVKSSVDRAALRRALADGTIYTVGTDHAPHELKDKQGGAAKAASGMPMIQFSLPAMLQLVSEGVLTIEQVATLMCHHPAELFGIRERGFIREGYHADLAIVRPDTPWTVDTDTIESKCGWSPMLGEQFTWRVEQTICNGIPLLGTDHRLRHPHVFHGEAVSFR